MCSTCNEAYLTPFEPEVEAKGIHVISEQLGVALYPANNIDTHIYTYIDTTTAFFELGCPDWAFPLDPGASGTVSQNAVRGAYSTCESNKGNVPSLRMNIKWADVTTGITSFLSPLFGKVKNYHRNLFLIERIKPLSSQWFVYSKRTGHWDSTLIIEK